MTTERCDRCNQTFNSERELEEHRRSAHPEQQQGQQKERQQHTPQGEHPKRHGEQEKIA